MIRVLDSSGDRAYPIHDAASEQAAREIFEGYMRRGYHRAFKLEGGRVDKFEQIDSETLVVPIVVGG